MKIDAEINSYLSKFSDSEKETLLNLIRNFSNERSISSIAEKIALYNNELEAAVQKIKAGKYIDHADVLNEANEW